MKRDRPLRKVVDLVGSSVEDEARVAPGITDYTAKEKAWLLKAHEDNRKLAALYYHRTSFEKDVEKAVIDRRTELEASVCAELKETLRPIVLKALLAENEQTVQQRVAQKGPALSSLDFGKPVANHGADDDAIFDKFAHY